jgi:hypothetical protein
MNLLTISNNSIASSEYPNPAWLAHSENTMYNSDLFLFADNQETISTAN